jgi:hypothetical protein
MPCAMRVIGRRVAIFGKYRSGGNQKYHILKMALESHEYHPGAGFKNIKLVGNSLETKKVDVFRNHCNICLYHHKAERHGHTVDLGNYNY